MVFVLSKEIIYTHWGGLNYLFFSPPHALDGLPSKFDEELDKAT